MRVSTLRKTTIILSPKDMFGQKRLSLSADAMLNLNLLTLHTTA